MNISDLNHVETVVDEKIQGAAAFSYFEVANQSAGKFFAKTFTSVSNTTTSFPSLSTAQTFIRGGSEAF